MTFDESALTGMTGLGDESWVKRLFPRVYRELKEVARRQLGQAAGHSFDTTGLVHEAYLKLSELDRSVVQNRQHFLAISARAMRQVLVAAARKRYRLKRGAGQRPITLTESRARPQGQQSMRLDQVLVINDALERLQRLDPRLCLLVECRFFAGLTEDETAEALAVSVSTVQRDWRRAKGWLKHYFENPADGSASEGR